MGQEADRRPQPGVRGDARPGAARGHHGPRLAEQDRAGYQGSPGHRPARGRRGPLDPDTQYSVTSHSSCTLYFIRIEQFIHIIQSFSKCITLEIQNYEYSKLNYKL